MDAVALCRLSRLSRYTCNALQQRCIYSGHSKNVQCSSKFTSRYYSARQGTGSSLFQRNVRCIALSSDSGKRQYSSSTKTNRPLSDTNRGQTAATAESSRSTFPNLREQAPKDVPAPEPNERGEVPAYDLTFTCKPCKTRSTHRISKHGYHNGTVLITCPECKNRHVISDHLKIFNDNKKSFEQILKEKGELLKTGVLDPDRDIELWDDGSQIQRKGSATASEASSK